MTSVTLRRFIHAYLARQIWSYMRWDSHGSHTKHMIRAVYIRSMQVLCMFNKVYNECVYSCLNFEHCYVATLLQNCYI